MYKNLTFTQFMFVLGILLFIIRVIHAIRTGDKGQSKTGNLMECRRKPVISLATYKG